MAFNPNTYISQPSKGFDPDSYAGNTRLPASEEEISAPHAALLGALQGGSFGFADEAEGALHSPLGALKGALGHFGVNYTPTNDEDVKAYAEARDVARKQYESAEAQHPNAYLAGNVGGGVLPAVATGGLGLAGEGALGAAKIGALAGGLGGLGSSTATTLGGDISDIKSGAEGGAITGGVLGAGLGIAKAGIKAVGGILGDIGESQAAQTLAKAYKQGAQGTKVVGTKAKEAIEQNALNVAKKLGLIAENVRKGAGEELGAVTQKLAKSDTSTEISDLLNNLSEKVKDLRKSNLPEAQADADKLDSIITNFTQGPEVETPTQIGTKAPTPSAKEELENLAKTKSGVDKFFGGSENPAINETGQAGKINIGTNEEPNIQPTLSGAAPLGENNYSIIEIPGTSKIGLFDKNAGKFIKVMENTSATAETPIMGTETTRTGANTNLKFDALQQLKQDFAALSERGESGLLKTQQATNIATQGARGLKTAIEEGFPEMTGANAKYSAAKQSLDILGLDNSSFIKDPITGEITLHPQDVSKLTNLVRQAETDTSTGITSGNKLTTALDSLAQADPEKVAAIRKAVTEAGENLDLSHKASKIGLFNKLGTFQGNLVQAGNRLGLAANKAPEVAAKIVGATPEQIAQMAEFVAGLGKKAGGMASKVASMANKDSVGRNAVLFSLQQDPNYRKILHDITGVKDE